MTEQQWLASDDPEAMLAWICGPTRRGMHDRPCYSKRKLRLFACALWRALFLRRDYYVDQIKAVQLAEQWADTGEIPALNIVVAHYVVLNNDPIEAVEQTMGWANMRNGVSPAVQASLLRDIFGNPFRLPPLWRDGQLYALVGVEKEPARGRPGHVTNIVRHTYDSEAPTRWLRWNDGTVPKLARVIYEERRFEEMPVLADALEETGCDNEDILKHLRGWMPCCSYSDCIFCGGHGWKPIDPDASYNNGYGYGVASCRFHVRGCWVIDLLLGKEQ